MSALTEHYRNIDVPIEEFDSFASAHIEDVLNVLVTWSEELSRPTVVIPPEDPQETDEKKGTGLGKETGG